MSTLTPPPYGRLAFRVALYMTLKLPLVFGLFIVVDTLVLYPYAFGISATADFNYSKTLS